MLVSSKQILDVVRSWMGYNEKDGSFEKIINIYNERKPLARGYTFTKNDEWCDMMVSAAFIKLNAIEMIGETEISVSRHINIFKEKGIWIEDEKITPRPGDLICFTWDKDQTDVDHIGFVENVYNGIITTIEGNYGEKVVRNTYRVGDARIRGYARPQYTDYAGKGKTLNELADEVLAGVWGVQPYREQALTKAGYNYEAIQNIVNSRNSSTPTKESPVYTPKKTYVEVAYEVLEGDWGNNPERSKALTDAGYNAEHVQKIVNFLSANGEEVVKDVLDGDYGNNPVRSEKLRSNGYDPEIVQEVVNHKI